LIGEALGMGNGPRSEIGRLRHFNAVVRGRKGNPTSHHTRGSGRSSRYAVRIAAASSKSSCSPVGNVANVRIYFLDVLGSGSSLAQAQASSRDASPNSEVIGEEPVAQKTCRFSAAASAGPTSVTPDYPEHCGIFLPLAGGRSGRSSPLGCCCA